MLGVRGSKGGGGRLPWLWGAADFSVGVMVVVLGFWTELLSTIVTLDF